MARDRLGIVGNAQHAMATSRPGMRLSIPLVFTQPLLMGQGGVETLCIARP